MRDLLTIVQTACGELGLPEPASVIGSTDPQSVQMLRLANREGKDLAARESRSGGWPQLRKVHTDTFVSAQANYPFPSDLQYFINTTSWDRDQKWPMRGPISPQVWQVLKSGTIGSVGPRRRFRIMAGEIYFDPTPGSTDAGDTFAIEYYSDLWCESSGGTGQSLWASDDDVPVLPDDCFILGLKWRFRKAKGFAFDAEYLEYEREVTREMGRSGMAPILDLARPLPAERLLDDTNIPDSGYGDV